MTEKSDASVLIGGEQAARLVGIGYRRLDQWCREGLLAPVEIRKGKRGFSLGDLVTARVLAGLRALGLPLPAVKLVAENLAKRPHWPNERLRVRYFLGNLIAIEALPDGDAELPPHVSLPIDGQAASREVLSAWVKTERKGETTSE